MKTHVEFDLELARNPYRGLLIALEGVDGSGKTTQVERLVVALEKRKLTVIKTTEPTDEPTGKFVRSALSGELPLPPVALQYLFCADRAVHQEKIKKDLEPGTIVISDRYFWSSVAYGIVDVNAEGDRLLMAYSILSMYHKFLTPDITFYLNIDIDATMERISDKKNKEIYENRERLTKVKKAYEDFLLKKFPEEFVVINADKPEAEITEELLEIIEKKLNEKTVLV